jgi:LAS superfamily LD-carboxypeptidase LdcB
MWRRAIGASLACSIGSALLASGSTFAAVPHTVLPGESLWSISAANNLTMQSVAAYNGLSEDSLLLVGTTIYIPTVGEGAAPAATSTQAPAPAPGMATIPSPYGELPLQPAAADAWNRMRAEALSVYGIDLYPGGAMSAYRTYEQQAQLHAAYLAGYGAPANPPGTSSHEWGTAVDVATPEMRAVIDQIGAKYGWSKVHGPGEWWHVDYVGG